MIEPMLRRADATDHELLERLWVMFRHDMSEFSRTLPNIDGAFRTERLHASVEHPDWGAFIVELGDRPVGLALIRRIEGPTRVLSGFFIVRGARRAGIGQCAVRRLVKLYPGRWEVAFQTGNSAAAAFWRHAAASISETWTEELRPIPGRKDLAEDRWISFIG